MVSVHVNLLCPVALCGGKVTLLPGSNEVDPAQWKQVERHPITQALLQARSIEVEKARGGRGGGRASQGEGEAGKPDGASEG